MSKNSLSQERIWTACNKGYLEVVRELLKDKRVLSKDLSSAMEVAQQASRREIVKLLSQSWTWKIESNEDKCKSIYLPCWTASGNSFIKVEVDHQFATYSVCFKSTMMGSNSWTFNNSSVLFHWERSILTINSTFEDSIELSVNIENWFFETIRKCRLFENLRPQKHQKDLFLSCGITLKLCGPLVKTPVARNWIELNQVCGHLIFGSLLSFLLFTMDRRKSFILQAIAIFVVP